MVFNLVREFVDGFFGFVRFFAKPLRILIAFYCAVSFAVLAGEKPAYTGYVEASEIIRDRSGKDENRVFYRITENSITRMLWYHGGVYATTVYVDEQRVELFSGREGEKLYTELTLREFQHLLDKQLKKLQPEHFFGIGTYYRKVQKKRKNVKVDNQIYKVEGKVCRETLFNQKREIREKVKIHDCPGLVPASWLRYVEVDLPDYANGFPVEFKVDIFDSKYAKDTNSVKKWLGKLDEGVDRTKSVFYDPDEFHYKVKTYRKHTSVSFPNKAHYKYMATVFAIISVHEAAETRRKKKEQEELEREFERREKERKSRGGKSGSSELLDIIF